MSLVAAVGEAQTPPPPPTSDVLQPAPAVQIAPVPVQPVFDATLLADFEERRAALRAREAALAARDAPASAEDQDRLAQLRNNASGALDPDMANWLDETLFFYANQLAAMAAAQGPVLPADGAVPTTRMVRLRLESIIEGPVPVTLPQGHPVLQVATFTEQRRALLWLPEVKAYGTVPLASVDPFDPARTGPDAEVSR